MYYVYRVGQFLAMNLPRGFSYAIAYVVSALYYVCSRKHRFILSDNLRVALGGRPEKVIEKYTKVASFNFAKYLVDFLCAKNLNLAYIKKNVKLVGLEHLDSALKKGKGVVFLSLHLGNWELGGIVLAKLGYDVDVIALSHKDERLNKFFVKQRVTQGIKVIPLGSALKKCVSTLKNNGAIAILGDRLFNDKGVVVDFFGRKTRLPKGAAYFSLRTGAPIVPCVMVRQKNDKYALLLEAPIPTEDCQGPDRIQQVTQKCAAVMERYIKKYPSQWYVFSEVWDK